jgi:hypothetical protein
VPSFLSLVGAAAAVAFGAGENVAVAGGVANSIFTAGKAYYVPQQKAGFLNRARHAVHCIGNESVGIAAYTIPVGDKDEGNARGRRRGGGSISLPFELQYYRMVENALRSVDTILADRLNTLGTYDPAGIASQIKTLNDEIRQAEEERKDVQEGRSRSRRTGTREAELAQLELDVLQPKLQECVVRAKM